MIGLGESPPDGSPDDGAEHEFDFNAHRNAAEDEYRRVQGTYRDFAETIRTLLARALEAGSVPVHSIEARAKQVDSLGRKAARPEETAPDRPKYARPLEEIKDLAGARVITFFLNSVQKADIVISEQFEVLERSNRSAFLRGGGERLGYESMHYVVRLHPGRLAWPEYAKYAGLTAEIQVRTILQHAWAEIEHDVQYKSVEALPSEIRRRFLALAGMIEIGDREFQAIADAHDAVRINAKRLMREGRLDEVELTPESLRDYLDAKFGPDGRMTEYTYVWWVRNLKRYGFSNLAELDACVSPYDDDQVSRVLFGTRHGQLSRLDYVLLASMGENYVAQHPWALSETGDVPAWLSGWSERSLQKLRESGINIGSYMPGNGRMGRPTSA